MRKYEQIGIAKEQEKYNDEKRKFMGQVISILSEYENHHLAEEGITPAVLKIVLQFC